MLGDDRPQIMGARRVHPLRPNPGVVGVQTVATSQTGSGSERCIEQARRERTKKDRQAAVDNRKVRTTLAHVVKQCGLLQQRGRIWIQAAHGREHVEAMTLVVHR